MLRILQTFLGTVPYCHDANSEGHYQQVLYIIFTLLSDYFADVEIHTPTGRVDVVMRTDTTLYLFELKLNKDARTAMEQIRLKDHAPASPSVPCRWSRSASISTQNVTPSLIGR